MASLPYVTSPGNIDKAFAGIKQAAVPERVSQDFVKTILKIPGGSGAQITSFLKKIGFASADGSPTDIYKKFRIPNFSGAAVASAIRSAYEPLYIRNEFMHDLGDRELIGLLVEETGQAHDSNVVKMIAATIKHLKAFADFSDDLPSEIVATKEPERSFPPQQQSEGSSTPRSLGLNLGYTINLNLPATSDPEVFDAIFRSLKEHLLGAEDA